MSSCICEANVENCLIVVCTCIHIYIHKHTRTDTHTRVHEPAHADTFAHTHTPQPHTWVSYVHHNKTGRFRGDETRNGHWNVSLSGHCYECQTTLLSLDIAVSYPLIVIASHVSYVHQNKTKRRVVTLSFLHMYA